MNPHPDAKCPYCGATKPCVGWEACSDLCADILGVPKQGLPTQAVRDHERLREMGFFRGPIQQDA